MGARRLHLHRRADLWGIALLGLLVPAGACAGIDANHEASAGASGSGGAAASGTSSASVGGGGASASVSSGSGVVGPCAAAPWARDLGPSSSVSEVHQALGADCTTIVTGYFKGALDLGNGPLSANADAKGLFVAKLDGAGHTLWSRAFEATVDVGSPAIAVDSQGSIVLTGNFTGTLDLGSGPLASGDSSNVFVARLDADGHPLWSQRYSIGGDMGDLAVDTAGNVVVGGTFGGDLDFGLGVIHAGVATHGFLVKLDPIGTPLWQKDIASPDEATVYGLALDATGAVTFTGRFRTSIGLGFTSIGDRDAYVARYDANGMLLWARQLGGDGVHMGLDVAVDEAGNSAVGGLFGGTIDLGNGPIMAQGSGLAFAARYDPQGNITWGRSFKVPYDVASVTQQRLSSVAFGPAGQLWMAGQFTSAIDFGGGPLLGPGPQPSAFVAELDPAGNQLGAAKYGTSGSPGYGSSGDGIQVDAAGRAHVVGTLTGSGSFDGGSLKSTGDGDVFVATVDF
jgi:hypothetical protein